MPLSQSHQPGAHSVLLEHYYSTDFPWRFDRKMTKLLITGWLEKKLSNDWNSKVQFAIWQKICFCWILSACISGLRFQINVKVKSMHGSSWKKIYYIKIYSIFCRSSPFHREWLPLINILMIETFSQKANQNLSRLWPIEAIHGEKDLPCKN